MSQRKYHYDVKHEQNDKNKKILYRALKALAVIHQEENIKMPVAQWLEPTAHNGLVGGSSPSRHTSKGETAHDKH